MESIKNTAPGGLPLLPYNIVQAGLGGLGEGFGSVLDTATKPLEDRTGQPDPSEARRQLIDAGKQFEAYFMSYLLKVMRETVPQGLLSNKQVAYFHSFYDQEIGMRAAQAGGIGIARMVQEYAERYFPPSPAQPSSSSR